MIETSPAPSVSHDKPPAILSLIGDTPLVEITQIDTGPCHLFLKLENQNPGGSIKDRIALSMIEAAEREGHLGPGGTVIEATAGTNANHNGINIMPHLFPNFRPGSPLVGKRIRRIAKLIHIKSARNFVGKSRGHVLIIFRMTAGYVGTGQPNLGTKCPHVRDFLL